MGTHELVCRRNDVKRMRHQHRPWRSRFSCTSSWSPMSVHRCRSAYVVTSGLRRPQGITTTLYRHCWLWQTTASVTLTSNGVTRRYGLVMLTTHSQQLFLSSNLGITKSSLAGFLSLRTQVVRLKRRRRRTHGLFTTTKCAEGIWHQTPTGATFPLITDVITRAPGIT
jgi:hypothetical protein